MKRRDSAYFLLFPALCLALWSASAGAQQPAQGIMKTEAATTGSTEVAAGGFEKPPDREEVPDATDLKLSAGGLFSSGNSRLIAMTSSVMFRARRDENQLTVDAAGNYAEAATDPDSGTKLTAANLQGRTRYDRFLLGGLAAFLSLSGRNDRFQGLDLRLNLDPGLAYYVLDRDKHRLWFEAGYDYQHDIRRAQNVREAELEGNPMDRSEVRHSARGFVGYDNHLNAAVSLFTGLEYLQGIPETEFWRLNWDVGLTSVLYEKFSFSTTFSLRYDHEPLPGIEELDTVTAVNLVYQLL